jgi:hypothetical protein
MYSKLQYKSKGLVLVADMEDYEGEMNYLKNAAWKSID